MKSIASCLSIGAIAAMLSGVPANAQEIVIYGSPSNALAGLGYAYKFLSNALPGYRVLRGALPPGLRLAQNGIISGVLPADSAGSYTFTVAALSNNIEVAKEVTLSVIDPAGSLRVLNAQSRWAIEDRQYSSFLDMVGGVPPYRIEMLRGALPPGLTISSLGQISGTVAPGQASRNFEATVLVRDSAGASTEAGIVIGVLSQPTRTSVAVTSPNRLLTAVGLNTAPTATLGLPTLTATGGVPLNATLPHRWQVESSTLPPGVALAEDGRFSGFPTEAGVYWLAVFALDTTGGIVDDLLIVVRPSINVQPTVPAGSTNTDYSGSLTVSGGMRGTQFFVVGQNGALVPNNVTPTGLTLDSRTGRITGRVSANPGTYILRIAAYQPPSFWAGGINTVFEITQTIGQAAVSNPAITTTSLPGGQAGVAYSQPLSATGGTGSYTWAIASGSLPAGLTLNSSSGTIGGTPTAASVGISTFTLSVNSGSATAVRTLSITITAATPPLTITTSTLPNGQLGAAYSQTLAASGGTGTYTWIHVAPRGPMPPGLTLSTAGVISGTPTTIGSYTFVVLVNASVERTYTVVIGAAAAAPRVNLTVADPARAPTAQTTLTPSLSAAYPTALTGMVRLTFTSRATNAANDPNYRFSTGDREAAFTVAANSTAMAFTGGLRLQNGTTAGDVLIHLVSLRSGNTDLITAAQELAAYSVAMAAPVITNASVVSPRNASGVTIRITGYSTSRALTEAAFNFSATGATITNPPPVSIAARANTHYQEAASVSTGGTFNYDQTFSITGAGGADGNSVTGVTITISNGQGASVQRTVAF